MQTVNDHLQAGREALRLALGGHVVPGGPLEDITRDPKLLESAREHFETAASLFKAGDRLTDEAHVRIDIAEVYLNMPPTHDTCTAAEASCRTALDMLDSAEDPIASLRAYVLLAEAMVLSIGHGQEGFEKEQRIKRALGILRAAEYLAAGQDVPMLRARVHEAFSRVLGERFSGDRDANLLEAIRLGQRALPVFRQAQTQSPLRYASLQVHLGNCYMKLDGPRSRWLEEGLAAYKDGLDSVDSKQAPRLYSVLMRNMTMVEALIAEKNSMLPEKEMMGRFGAKLQFALDHGDIEGAEAAAWDTLRWAWSRSRTPNVWVAEAHKLFGSLLLHRGDAGHACDHFYSATALLFALAEPGGPQQAALLGGARQLLGEAMEHLGQAELTEELSSQADGAFIAARQHCARGSQLVAGDAKAAYDEFNQAIALFPYDPLALFYRGAVSMNLSNPEAALHDFDGALSLQPQNVATLVNRAVVKTELGDTEGALADYASALDIDPENLFALYNRSVIRTSAGDYEAALNDLDRLIAAHPEMRAAYELRTVCLEHLGRHE